MLVARLSYSRGMTDTAIDPADLDTCLRVIAGARRPAGRASRRGRRAPRHRAASSRPSRSAAAPSAARAVLEADAAVTAATATGAPGRIDDETQGLPLTPAARGRERRHAAARARVLRLQAALPRGRRLLPPAVPGLRGAQPRAPRRAHRPDRPPRAAHRRPREDRHVHRAAAAARRRAHDDHDALPARRRPPLRRDARQRATGSTGCGSSASTCATRPRSSRSPTRSPAQGPLDILINNAAQTVRRSPEAYALLADAEAAPLPARRRCRRCSRSAPRDTRASGRRCPARRAAALDADAARAHRARADRRARPRPSASPPARAIDAGGLVPDLHAGQQLDPARRRGRPGRAARGAAVQHDRAVHPRQPAARRRSRRRRRGARTSSTSPRWRGSSAAATRGPGIRTRTWPRPR